MGVTCAPLCQQRPQPHCLPCPLPLPDRNMHLAMPCLPPSACLLGTRGTGLAGHGCGEGGRMPCGMVVAVGREVERAFAATAPTYPPRRWGGNRCLGVAPCPFSVPASLSSLYIPSPIQPAIISSMPIHCNSSPYSPTCLPIPHSSPSPLCHMPALLHAHYSY